MGQKLMFIVYGTNDSKCCEYEGIEVYIIHADSLDEARERCPIPLYSKFGDNPEYIIKQIVPQSISEVDFICEYYA